MIYIISLSKINKEEINKIRVKKKNKKQNKTKEIYEVNYLLTIVSLPFIVIYFKTCCYLV